MNEQLATLIGSLGLGSAILALIKIWQTRQTTQNAVTLTNELELAKVRAELRERITTLEKTLVKSQEHYDLEICKLRNEITLWQARYYQLQGVADQQREIITRLQEQVDAMEAGNVKDKAA
jgi:hypothetical protein